MEEMAAFDRRLSITGKVALVAEPPDLSGEIFSVGGPIVTTE